MVTIIFLNVLCVLIGVLFVRDSYKKRELKLSVFIIAAIFMQSPLFALGGWLISSVEGAFGGFLIAFCGGLLGYLLLKIIEAKKCTVPITAEFLSYERHSSKGSEYFCPIFKWEYEGEMYQGHGNRYFSKRIKKRLTEGESYTIFINPEYPEKCEYKGMFPMNDLIAAMFICLGLAAGISLTLSGFGM